MVFLQLLFMKCDILQILPIFVCFMCQIWILCRPGNWHYVMYVDRINPCSFMYLFSGIHIIKLSLNSWFEDEKIKIIAFKFCLWEKNFVLIKSRCCTLHLCTFLFVFLKGGGGGNNSVTQPLIHCMLICKNWFNIMICKNW